MRFSAWKGAIALALASASVFATGCNDFDSAVWLSNPVLSRTVVRAALDLDIGFINGGPYEVTKDGSNRKVGVTIEGNGRCYWVTFRMQDLIEGITNRREVNGIGCEDAAKLRSKATLAEQRGYDPLNEEGRLLLTSFAARGEKFSLKNELDVSMARNGEVSTEKLWAELDYTLGFSSDLNQLKVGSRAGVRDPRGIADVGYDYRPQTVGIRSILQKEVRGGFEYIIWIHQDAGLLAMLAVHPTLLDATSADQILNLDAEGRCDLQSEAACASKVRFEPVTLEARYFKLRLKSADLSKAELTLYSTTPILGVVDGYEQDPELVDMNQLKLDLRSAE